MDKKCSKCKQTIAVGMFYKNRSRKGGLQSECTVCRKAYWATPAGKACSAKHTLRDGYGVYLATFPSGDYIGSGQITRRRNDHMNGNSGIARKLGEKAISFEVLILCDKDRCLQIEGDIQYYCGLDTLLNKKYAWEP